MTTMTDAEFLAIARSNPVNRELERRLAALGLPEGHLVAGCLFQAIWNQRSGRPADWGVKDYDVFYFDAADTSWEAEDRVIAQVAEATADLGVEVELRNQARVHLWYEKRFGAPYPQLHSARDGIDRYLVTCTCVGIELASGALYAPNGLHDLAEGRLASNPLNPLTERFTEKAESYRARWPWLTVVA